MRGVLRLAGQSPGLETYAVIERAAALLGADATPMLACFEARRTTHGLSAGLTDALVVQYLEFAHALLRHVDVLPANYTGPAGGSERQSGHLLHALTASNVGPAS